MTKTNAQRRGFNWSLASIERDRKRFDAAHTEELGSPGRCDHGLPFDCEQCRRELGFCGPFAWETDL